MWTKVRVRWSRHDSPWAQLNDDISLDIQGMKIYETKKIALYCTCSYSLLKSIILCDKAHDRGGTLKAGRGNLYVVFLNSAFSLDIPSSLSN